MLHLARQILQDARHAFRVWARRPLHIVFTILALAIGIGANVGVFSVVNALLLRSLPFREPARLASLRWFFPPHDTAAQFHDWRRQSAYLADAAGSEEFDVNLGGANQWRRAHLAATSWNFFALLGTQPALGRSFAPGEDEPGRNNVAIISYSLWQELFAGNPRVLGAVIHADSRTFTIIGVAPPAFDFPGKSALWVPGGFSPGNNGWQIIGRLKPGVTWQQAREEFGAEADRLWPNRDAASRISYPTAFLSLRDELAGPSRNASLALLVAVSLILLIACTNVASLALVRTADRAAEFTTRSALGASRRRLIQQLLTESLLLSIAAAIAGFFVAFWTASLAARLQPAPLAAQAYSILDARVLAFAAAISVVVGLLFGVLPALQAGRVVSLSALAPAGNHRGRFVRESLVAAQIAFTIVLLAGSVSVGRAFLKLTSADRGFVPRGLVTVSVSFEGTALATPESRTAYVREALARLRRLPAVRSASTTEFLPLDATGFVGGPFGIDGHPAHEGSMLVPVASDYFQTMGDRILFGREFTGAEVRDDAQVAVVNERFASLFGSPADSLGHVVTMDSDFRMKIIGVVKPLDYMTEAANPGQIYVPAHTPSGFASTFVVRMNDSAEGRLASNNVAMIRDTIQSVNPEIPVFGAKTMQQRLSTALARPDFYRTAVGCFAAIALLLAAIGVYGIVAYAVSRRTREMGVRMALGSTPLNLRANLLWQHLVPVIVGAIPGIAAALLSGHWLESLVAGAQSVSLATAAASVLFIAAITSLCIWSATRPLTRLDIAEILRAE